LGEVGENGGVGENGRGGGEVMWGRERERGIRDAIAE
jgi:hypothetical protein